MFWNRLQRLPGSHGTSSRKFEQPAVCGLVGPALGSKSGQLNTLNTPTTVSHEYRLRLKKGRALRESNFYLFAVGIGIGIGIAIENGVDRVKADTDTEI